MVVFTLLLLEAEVRRLVVMLELLPLRPRCEFAGMDKIDRAFVGADVTLAVSV